MEGSGTHSSFTEGTKTELGLTEGRCRAQQARGTVKKALHP